MIVTLLLTTGYLLLTEQTEIGIVIADSNLTGLAGFVTDCVCSHCTLTKLPAALLNLNARIIYLALYLAFVTVSSSLT